MVKKVFVTMVLVVLFSMLYCCSVLAESVDDWTSAPVITKAYEQSYGKIYIEWKGNAPVYQVYVDGTKTADVIVNHHVIDLEKGSHSIVVYPINEIREAETKIDFGFNVKEAGGELSIDLASLGLDPKRLAAGNPSDKLTIDYIPSQIRNGTPDSLSAVTDSENRVVFTFADQYFADEYLLTVKHKNDINYLTYRVSGEKESKLITKEGTIVSIVLDPIFLMEQECMVPVLNEEYRFTVQLRKYGVNLISGEKENTVISESKVSGELAYRVTAAWKIAPIITFASQTADGTISLQWDHNDYGNDCEYAIIQINKVLGVMTGEEEWGRTSNHEFSMIDLKNGNYCINIVPFFDGEKGNYSADANVEVKNEWVIAPELICEQIDTNQVKLTWEAPANVEGYHITVSTGDNASLLRFVDLDYSKYTDVDIEAVEGEMEYIFVYDKDIDGENGTKMKFEVYGLRHTTSGDEQRSATSMKTIILR